MDNTQEVTYYRFLSEIKAFLGKLLANPIKAEPSKYLKDLGFTRSRIINLLMKKDILERNEKILTPDKTGAKKVKYSVTFKVKKKNFERIMRRIYTRYFEKNLPEKEPINEWMDMSSCGILLGATGGKGGQVGSEMCDRWGKYVNDAKDEPRSFFANDDKMKQNMLKDERDREAYLTRGGMKGIEELEECDCGGTCGGDVAGATSCTSSGQYVKPFTGYLLTRQQLALAQTRNKDKDYTDPTKILGKNISEEKKKTTMARKIYLTEAQLNYIIKEEAMASAGATSTSSVGAETTRGDMGYDVPAFGKSKNTRKNKSEKGTDSDFFKSSMDRKPGFSCERLDEETDENLKGALVGAAMGASLLGGGGNVANAAPSMEVPKTGIEASISQNIKFTEDQLIRMFPEAYKDKDKSPEVWSKNRVKYCGLLPIKTKDGKNVNDSTGMKAARNMENPWVAICKKYLKIPSRTIAFNDVK